MRRALFIGCLALFTGAAGSARADEPQAFVATSADYAVSLEQTLVKKGCKVEAKRGKAVLWTSDRCLEGDLHFLANDGERLISLYAFPQKAGGMRGAKGVELYRQAERKKSFSVGTFIRDERPLINASRHFYWLEGALRQPGVPPGVTVDGKGVELTTLDGRRYLVGFDGNVKALSGKSNP